jgi:hypothetical protein
MVTYIKLEKLATQSLGTRRVHETSPGHAGRTLHRKTEELGLALLSI